MSNRDELPFIHDTQLPLSGLGPLPGERWRNRNTGTIVSVISTEQKRHGWVTIRAHGTPATVKVARFLAVFERI